MKIFFCLIISLVILNASGLCQWYSYDGFKKESITISQTYAIAQKNFQQKAVTLKADTSDFSTSSVKNFIVQNASEYLQKLQQQKKALKNDVSAVNAQLIDKETAIRNATNGDTIKKLEAELAEINAKRDELTKAPELNTNIADKIEELRYLRKRLPGFRFFPVTRRLAAESYFENKDTIVHSDDEGTFNLEYAYLNYLNNSKRLGIFTEPLSDYIGPVRLSLGLLFLVPATKDTAKTNAPVEKIKTDSINNLKSFMDRFKSGGGTATLNASYPLFQAHDVHNYFDLKSYLSPRFCIDVPKEDTSIQRFAHHTQLGVETQLKIKTFKNVFNFLLCHRYARIMGNRTFYDNMGFTGSDRKAFDFTTWTVGFIAKGTMAVYYTWYAGKSLVTQTIANNKSLTVNFQL